MFLFREPSEERLEEFLCAQRDAYFAYGEVGVSREGAPRVPGYAVDHNRVRLGSGEETFDRAVEAVRSWKMFDVGWVRVFPPGAPVDVGTTVVVLGRHYGLWSLNACRVVYLIEETGDVFRNGLAYGTLPEHGESGEERFTVEWNREDGSVHYDLYAFSRPNHLFAKAGYPFARALQRRFAKDSLRAMVRATSQA